MSEEELAEIFEKHDDEYLKFNEIKEKRASCADLHAFLLLNELAPGSSDIVCGVGYKEFFVRPTLEDLSGSITEEQVVELVRCGVRVDSDGYLALFT